jgi:hypothetical protein
VRFDPLRDRVAIKALAAADADRRQRVDAPPAQLVDGARLDGEEVGDLLGAEERSSEAEDGIGVSHRLYVARRRGHPSPQWGASFPPRGLEGVERSLSDN